MIYKIGLSIMAIIAFFVGAIWTFNHINAWIGIILGILGTLFLIDKLVKIVKKQINQNENEN